MHRLIFCRDEPLRNALARSFAGRREFELVEAAGGEDMLEMATRRGAALLLAPLRLPDMAGGELCARLREVMPEAPPVVLIGPESEQEGASVAGASGYIVAPWSRVQLLTAIRVYFPVPERSAARTDVSLKVLCGGGSETYVAFTKDISATGMFLKGISLAQPGSRIRVRLSLPDEGRPEELDMSAEVVRRVSEDGDGRGHAGLGVRFVDLPMMKKLPITRFVRRHAGDEGAP
jgi:CheY-like chemotaxis protein